MSGVNKQVYLFNDTEVILTGRRAVKRSPKDKNKVIDIVVEIQTFHTNEPSWKKWVRITDLYDIVDESQNPDAFKLP